MRCPTCGSKSYEVVNSKVEVSKTKKYNKLLLKCNDCESVYRETLTEKKPDDYRIIISEHDFSRKSHVKLYPEGQIQVGDVLDVDGVNVEITSIETKRGSRVSKSPLSEVETIWALSLDIPARVGISIDFRGRVISKKVEVDRNFEFGVGDIIKIGKFVLRIHSIKTMTRRLKKGTAAAFMVKRVYGKPLDERRSYDYDLSNKVVG